MKLLVVFLSLLLSLSYCCETDLECSLNGICDKSSGFCECDKPWSGDMCDVMMFKPVQMPQGYGQQPEVVSWGGGIVYDDIQNKYHLYVSVMTNDCSLEYWGTNSRIDHAISDNITGPFLFQDVAVNVHAHNSAPIQLPDGTYAIVHIGTGINGTNGGVNCTGNVSSLDVILSNNINSNDEVDDDAIDDTGSTIHVSDSLDGPWRPLIPNTLGACNNPGPWVHPNGTIFIICKDNFKRADSIEGPWTLITALNHTGEDAFLYTDKRGNFHTIYHVFNSSADGSECVDSVVSAHTFSDDGFHWHRSVSQPYTTQVELTTGDVITVATRERPKIFFDGTGTMTHLVNGVCSVPQCSSDDQPCVQCKLYYPDYTLVAPFDI